MASDKCVSQFNPERQRMLSFGIFFDINSCFWCIILKNEETSANHGLSFRKRLSR